MLGKGLVTRKSQEQTGIAAPLPALVPKAPQWGSVSPAPPAPASVALLARARRGFVHGTGPARAGGLLARWGHAAPELAFWCQPVPVARARPRPPALGHEPAARFNQSWRWALPHQPAPGWHWVALRGAGCHRAAPGVTTGHSPAPAMQPVPTLLPPPEPRGAAGWAHRGGFLVPKHSSSSSVPSRGASAVCKISVLFGNKRKGKGILRAFGASGRFSPPALVAPSLPVHVPCPRQPRSAAGQGERRERGTCPG